MTPDAFQLKMMIPLRTVVDQEIRKLKAEGVHGTFVILPRHVDCAIELKPCLLSYEQEDGEIYYAIDGGLLVKCGQEVKVITPQLAGDAPLGELQASVRAMLQDVGDQEARARRALQRIETDIVRRFMEMDR
jgi:F-type H+-transporting ATPase subunit epsilon